MRIAVTGSSGLVGCAITEEARVRGIDVIPVLRSASDGSPGVIHWDPDVGQCNPDDFEDLDAVIHLAGENIAAGRWTEARKKRIADSRISGTQLLAGTLARCANPPLVLICASAIGYYGSRGDTVLDEAAGPGRGFLPSICERWEGATRVARDAGIRVVQLRIGVVLSRDGGALARMLVPSKLGLGGPIGSGRQWMSWIELEDVVGVALHAVSDPSLEGPVNCVAPNPATNGEFTKLLGRSLHRPTMFPLPAFLAKLLLGEMAEELLLASTRVTPGVLQAAGYQFRHPELGAALRHALRG